MNLYDQRGVTFWVLKKIAIFEGGNQILRVEEFNLSCHASTVFFFFRGQFFLRSFPLKFVGSKSSFWWKFQIEVQEEIWSHPYWTPTTFTFWRYDEGTPKNRKNLPTRPSVHLSFGMTWKVLGFLLGSRDPYDRWVPPEPIVINAVTFHLLQMAEN